MTNVKKYQEDVPKAYADHIVFGDPTVNVPSAITDPEEEFKDCRKEALEAYNLAKTSEEK